MKCENWDLSRAREKKATAKQAFTFPGATPTESIAAQRGAAGAQRLDSGGGLSGILNFVNLKG